MVSLPFFFFVVFSGWCCCGNKVHDAIMTFDEVDLLAGSNAIDWDTIDIDSEAEVIKIPGYFKENYSGAMWGGENRLEDVSYLHLAALRGFALLTEHLLLRGANIGADCVMGGILQYHEVFPFHLAVLKNRNEVVNVFLKYKWNPNKNPIVKASGGEDGVRYGLGALVMAADQANLYIFKRLLAHGATFDPRAFHYAAIHGGSRAIEVMDYIVREYEVDVNLPFPEKNAMVDDEDGDCAIHSACERGNLEVVKWLVSMGADINIKSASDNKTPLDLALHHRKSKEVAILIRDAGGTISDTFKSTNKGKTDDEIFQKYYPEKKEEKQQNHDISHTEL